MRKILYLLLCILVFVSFESCHRDDDEVIVDLSGVVDIQENAVFFLSNQCSSGQNFKTAVNNCIQQLMQNQEVESAFIQDEKQIVIRYKLGCTGVIYFIEDEEDGEQKELEKTPNLELSKHVAKGEATDDLVLITNHKVLIWEAFPNDDYGRNSVTDTLSKIFTSCPDIDFDVKTITGDDCTIKSLYDLTQYGFVCISTHGTIIGDTLCWILTTEKPQKAPKKQLKDQSKIIVTVANGREIEEGINPVDNKTYLAVSNTFFSKYLSGTFETPSIVYVGACKSHANNSMKNCFLGEKKASVYLGFDNTVTKQFSTEVIIELTKNLLDKKLDMASAKKGLSRDVDPYPVSTPTTPPIYYHAKLVGKINKNPTYFPTGYVECPSLKKRWRLDSAHFFSNPYQNTTHFSQLQFGGPDFQIVYRLSKMNSLAEGTYEPYVINDIGADTLWETNFYPMRFLAGTYSGVNGSSFWHEPETHYYSIRGGELKYQKQNNLNKFTFDFEGYDGRSYHGVWLGELYQ